MTKFCLFDLSKVLFWEHSLIACGDIYKSKSTPNFRSQLDRNISDIWVQSHNIQLNNEVIPCLKYFWRLILNNVIAVSWARNLGNITTLIQRRLSKCGFWNRRKKNNVIVFFTKLCGQAKPVPLKKKFPLFPGFTWQTCNSLDNWLIKWIKPTKRSKYTYFLKHLSHSA